MIATKDRRPILRIQAVLPDRLYPASPLPVYLRTASLMDVDRARSLVKGFRNWRQVAYFLDECGPVAIRLRRRHTMSANGTRGTLVMHGEKSERIWCVVVGYSRETQMFRLLMPFGVAWGQVGRCWASADLVQKLLRDQETIVRGLFGLSRRRVSRQTASDECTVGPDGRVPKPRRTDRARRHISFDD